MLIKKFYNNKYCVINWLLLFNAQKNCLDTFIMKSMTTKFAAEIIFYPLVETKEKFAKCDLKRLYNNKYAA